MNISAKWMDFNDLDGQRLLSQLSARGPQWVSLLLVAVLGWQLARLVWLLVPAAAVETTIDAAAIPAAAGDASPAAADGANVQLIADAHLFGKASAGEAPAPPPQQPVENLAETRLSLTLKGTIAATDDAESIAIIADSRNEEKIYGIGDTVTQGASLHAVYADRVVLNRGGSLEVLKLPREFPAGTARSRRATPTVSRNDEQDSSRSIQTVVAQNVTKLADVIRPTPYFVGGQQQGYRVYPGRDRRQFAALGLRPGDLIKDIDGAALTDPQQAMQIFQSLGTAEQVSVTVERNGQPQTLVLNTNQLDLDDDQ
ncbi:MAG TPA: type II secretion system protein GspC [Woeseiaceae bacterium]|nr:type II secretion system protein GspC [Woeseiaceae bacterium]